MSIAVNNALLNISLARRLFRSGWRRLSHRNYFLWRLSLSKCKLPRSINGKRYWVIVVARFSYIVAAVNRWGWDSTNGSRLVSFIFVHALSRWLVFGNRHLLAGGWSTLRRATVGLVTVKLWILWNLAENRLFVWRNGQRRRSMSQRRVFSRVLARRLRNRLLSG